MLTLYTAVGILRFEDCLKNHKTPIVINNHREYGLSEEEFILWSCLAFHIRQIHELHTAFSERLKLHNRSENIPMEPYLNRLIVRGLIVKGDGLTRIDALYRLFFSENEICSSPRSIVSEGNSRSSISISSVDLSTTFRIFFNI